MEGHEGESIIIILFFVLTIPLTSCVNMINIVTSWFYHAIYASILNKASEKYTTHRSLADLQMCVSNYTSVAKWINLIA